MARYITIKLNALFPGYELFIILSPHFIPLSVVFILYSDGIPRFVPLSVFYTQSAVLSP